MRHLLQILRGNHSYFSEGQARYQGIEIGEKSDRLGSQCNWSRVRMSVYTRLILLNKIPVSTIRLPE